MLPPPITSASSSPVRANLDELARELVDGLRVEAELGGAHQRLAGQLQQDALEDRRTLQLWQRRSHVYATEYQA